MFNYHQLRLHFYYTSIFSLFLIKFFLAVSVKLRVNIYITYIKFHVLTVLVRILYIKLYCLDIGIKFWDMQEYFLRIFLYSFLQRFFSDISVSRQESGVLCGSIIFFFIYWFKSNVVTSIYKCRNRTIYFIEL